MNSQEDPRLLLLPLPRILPLLLRCAAPLITESPHLELNGANLIAVITIIRDVSHWNERVRHDVTVEMVVPGTAITGQ